VLAQRVASEGPLHVCSESITATLVFEKLADFDSLPTRRFDVIALPMKIAGGTGGPLHIIAVMPGLR
jgi:kynurenine formamidase